MGPHWHLQPEAPTTAGVFISHWTWSLSSPTERSDTILNRGGNYPTGQFMRDQMRQNCVPEMLRQAESYTTPPRPDYHSVMTPLFTEDDLKEWKERQRSHMNLLDSAEDLLGYAEYSDDEKDSCEPMMDDYELHRRRSRT